MAPGPPKLEPRWAQLFVDIISTLFETQRLLIEQMLRTEKRILRKSTISKLQSRFIMLFRSNRTFSKHACPNEFVGPMSKHVRCLLSLRCRCTHFVTFRWMRFVTLLLLSSATFWFEPFHHIFVASIP